MIQELNVNNFDQEINKDKPVAVSYTHLDVYKRQGNGWRSSWTWNHAAFSHCKYGQPGNPSVSCFDLRTSFWHRICLACCTCRLVG